VSVHKQSFSRVNRFGIRGNDRGSVTIMVALAMVALFAFAFIAIDGALLMATRTQLHSAADAAALAGASGLLEGSEAEATARAIRFAGYNGALEQNMSAVTITEDDISFPEPNVIRVRTHRTARTGDPLRTFFQGIINPAAHNKVDVAAVAAARAYDVCGSRCLKPWAVPDRWDDANGNGAYDLGEYYDPDATGYTLDKDEGLSIVVKVGDPQATIAPGVFFPVNYPPIDKYPGEDPLKGGAWYRHFISECEPYLVEPGDRLLTEPGNKVGPTMQGAKALINQDPNARWDADTQTVVESDFDFSPRITLVPFFDPTKPPVPGRDWVEVVKLGAFFIESTGPGSQVNARFLMISKQGPACPGGLSTSFIKSIALIE